MICVFAIHDAFSGENKLYKILSANKETAIQEIAERFFGEKISEEALKEHREQVLKFYEDYASREAALHGALDSKFAECDQTISEVQVFDEIKWLDEDANDCEDDEEN